MQGMNGTELARIVRVEAPGVRVFFDNADAEGIAPDLPRLIKPLRNEALAASLAGLHSRADSNSQDPV
jgi:hypothetical protein